MEFNVTVQTGATKFEIITITATNQRIASLKARESGLVCGIATAPKANPLTALLTSENAKDWKRFVAEYVTLMTSTAKNRAFVSGYQVKKVGGLYQITVGGKKTGYEPMDAATLYSWMERLPLGYFAHEADDHRRTLLG